MTKFENQYQHLYIPSSYFFVLLELSAAECEEPDIPMPYEKAKYFERNGHRGKIWDLGAKDEHRNILNLQLLTH